jgi:hypothetical protein
MERLLNNEQKLHTLKGIDSEEINAFYSHKSITIRCFFVKQWSCDFAKFEAYNLIQIRFIHI